MAQRTASRRPASPRVDGAAVAERRQELGRTQTDIARRVGCQPPYISQIENGHRPTVSAAFFLRLLAALGLGWHQRAAIQPAPKNDEVSRAAAA